MRCYWCYSFSRFSGFIICCCSYFLQIILKKVWIQKIDCISRYSQITGTFDFANCCFSEYSEVSRFLILCYCYYYFQLYERTSINSINCGWSPPSFKPLRKQNVLNDPNSQLHCPRNSFDSSCSEYCLIGSNYCCYFQSESSCDCCWSWKKKRKKSEKFSGYGVLPPSFNNNEEKKEQDQEALVNFPTIPLKSAFPVVIVAIIIVTIAPTSNNSG